jgi:hypothetical protein
LMSNSNTSRSLPSFVWIILIVAGFAALIGAVVLLFTGLANIEGLASIIMIVVAWLTLRGIAWTIPNGKISMNGFMTAVGILFFALMGMALDQPGNRFFNAPLQVFFCPQGSQLSRDVVVSSSRPGSVSLNQDFECVNSEGRTVDQITTPEVIGVRFAEYIFIGYWLLIASNIYSGLRRKGKPATA